MKTGSKTGRACACLSALTCCVLALTGAVAPAAAATYLYDDGTLDGAVSYTEASFANRFTISGVGQSVGTILIRQSEDGAGTANFYVWAADPLNNNLPGTVLGSVSSVAVPQGADWTVVDFSSLNIELTDGQIVYAGFVNGDSNAVSANYDADGTGHSYRKTGGGWAMYDPGDLMIRLTTAQDPSPTEPITVTASPTNAMLGDKLKATATGSQAPNPEDTISYEYEWAKCPAGGTWSAFWLKSQYVTASRLALGDRWKVRSRASAGGYNSAWVESAPVTIRTLLFRTIPADGDTNCQRRGYLQVNFRWPMVQSSVESNFTLTPAGGSAVPGTFTWKKIGLIMRFTPNQPLAQNTVYTARLPAGVVRRGPLRVNVASSFSFTTGGQPVPTAWSPTGAAAAVGSKVIVVFDKAIGAGSVTAETFTLTPAVAGSFTVANNRVTFTPSAPLEAGRKYVVWLSGQIATPTGRVMGRSFSWNFTTAAASAALAATAATQAAAGGSAITVNLTAAATVTAEVANLAGRVVATLPSRALPAGVSTLLWDGTSGQGTKAPAGRYFVRLRAAAADGTTVRCQAPLTR